MTAPAAVPPALTAGLNPEQAEAVRTLTGPLLVVAGPGSGKTRVLTHRIAALLATGSRPGQILAVTFTNKAAAEMRHRVAALVGEHAVERMWIATFHSACVRILRGHHNLVGLPRSFAIADTTDSLRLITEVLDAAGELTDLNPTEKRKFVKDVHRTISTAKNGNQGPADLQSTGVPDLIRAGRAMDGYNRALRARGAVDFDDILLLVLHLLRTHPQVAEQYANRFTHVLVDEFQDTNTVQWEITRLLGAQGNVCVVGDADQSIYAFRGANPQVLHAFTRTYPDAHVVRLGRNYRSTQNIVAAAQAVIEPNPAQHRAPMTTDNPAGDPVRVVTLETDLDEAKWVADQIAERGGQLGDHAILVRTNAQTRVLEMILRDRGVAHDVVGTVRFFDRAEVKDALAYLRLVVNPMDVTALERAVTVPRRGIGPATLGQVTGPVLEGQATIVEALKAAAAGTGRGTAGLRAFAEALDQVAEAVLSGGPAAGLEAALDVAGVRGYYTVKNTDGLGNERLENLAELVRSARDFTDGTTGADPQGRRIADLDKLEQTEAFLEFAALMSSAETPHDPATGAPSKAAVQIATMHSAKGKEWPHVYVVGVEEDICPHVRAKTKTELAEERRLLFVAVSRAQQTLDITHVLTRRTYNDYVDATPSRFLADLPSTVEEVIAEPSRPDRPRRTVSAGKWGGGQRQWSTPAAPARGGYRTGQGLPSLPKHPTPATRPSLRTPARAGASRAGLDPSTVPPGTNVTHPVFGAGVVEEVNDSTIAVRFTNARKVLSLAHAPLTPA